MLKTVREAVKAGELDTEVGRPPLNAGPASDAGKATPKTELTTAG